jgi:ABC-2 type transport system permease protein
MKLYIEKLMIIFNREFTGYFRTPLASIFLLVFLALSAGMTFFMGQFFQRGQADLNSFFVWHPWLFFNSYACNWNETLGRRKKVWYY